MQLIRPFRVLAQKPTPCDSPPCFKHLLRLVATFTRFVLPVWESLLGS